MAITTYSVTTTDVLNDVGGVDTSVIGASSTPVTTSMIEEWIDRGAGQLNMILESKGISPSGLDDNGNELMRAGVIAYAKAKVLEKFNRDASRAWEQFGSVRKTLREQEEDLGDNLDDGDIVLSNVESHEDGKEFTFRQQVIDDDKVGWSGW